MGLLLSFQMRRPLAQARRRLVMTFPVVPRELSHTHPQGSVVSSPSVHWAGVRAQRPTTEPPVMKPSRRWGIAPPASLTDHPELWVLGGRQRGLAVGGENREDWKDSREGWGVGTRRQGEGAAQK